VKRDLISNKNPTVIKLGRCMFQYIMAVLSKIMLLKVIFQLNTKTIIFSDIYLHELLSVFLM
jgi:hypothetical protein